MPVVKGKMRGKGPASDELPKCPFPAGPLPLISDAMELYSPKLQNLTHTTLTKENGGGSPQWEITSWAAH